MSSCTNVSMKLEIEDLKEQEFFLTISVKSLISAVEALLSISTKHSTSICTKCG